MTVPTATPGQVPSSQKIRVLTIIPGPEDGLSMIHAKKLVHEIEATGEVENRRFYLSLGMNPFQVARELTQVLRHCRAWQPAIVHGHFGSKTGIVTVMVARIVGAKSVLHFRGSDLNPAPSEGFLLPWLRNTMSQLANLFLDYRVFVSHQLKERIWFPRWMGDCWLIAPSGYDSATFAPADQAEARRDLGYSGNDPILVFIAGRAPKVKGEELVLQSVTLLRQRLDFRFVSVDGNMPPDKVARLLNAADCLIFASRFEGSPCSVQEALACGLPLVSVDVGDVRDLVEGISGVDIVARTPEALADAVEARLRHPARIAPPFKVISASFRNAAPRVIAIYRRLAEDFR